MYQGNILLGGSKMEDCIYLENSVLGRFIYTFKMEGLFGFKKCLRKQSLHPNKKNST